MEEVDISTSSRLSEELYDDEATNPLEKIDRLLEAETELTDFERRGERSVGVVFPDIYPNGIANLSHQNLYKFINERDGWYATRSYEPDDDQKDALDRIDSPYFTWEDKKPLKEHDLVMVSLPFEELAPKMLSILEYADIPAWAHNRIESDPLVICGGATPNYNPEPYAHFVDAFYIGEAEVGVSAILDTYERSVDEDVTRRGRLKMLAEVDGVYVPRFYRTEYSDDGELLKRRAIEPEADPTIEKTKADSIKETPTHSIFITDSTVYGEPSFSLEVGRGCAYSCNFCQYGHNNSPRWLDIESVRELIIEEALEETSIIKLFYEAARVGYLSELFEVVADLHETHDIEIRLGAFTANQMSERMISIAAECGQENIIVAPEAAAGEMRYMAGKEEFYEDEEIFEQAELCAEYGIPDFGLYLLMGLPNEQMRHVEKLGDLIADTEEHVNPDGVLEAHINPVFPKPLTPFQWARTERPERGVEKMNHLIEYLRNEGLTVDVDNVSKSVIGAEQYTASKANEDLDADVIIKGIVGTKMHYSQPIMARGDRRVADVIYDAYKQGNDREAWERALERHDIDDDAFFRDRDRSETLPWEFIENSISSDHRESMWEGAQKRAFGSVSISNGD